MTIVFAGAPIVNALVALTVHPPQGGIKAIQWPFFAGIVLAVIGAGMVTLYKPKPAAPSQSRIQAEPVHGLVTAMQTAEPVHE